MRCLDTGMLEREGLARGYRVNIFEKLLDTDMLEQEGWPSYVSMFGKLLHTDMLERVHV